MSSTQLPMFQEVGDPTARRDDDFYETFRWQVEALLRRVTLSPDWLYVEPCAGNLAIAGVLRDRGLHVWANDLVQREAVLDSRIDARSPALFDRVTAVSGRPVDVVITNVPFSEAFDIIRLALDRAARAVISLLRVTWDEPTEDRDEWLASHPLTARIVMPRAKYRGTSSSDSATHGWHIWDPTGALHVRPHDVVTRRERDELVAVYGGGRG